MYTVHYMHYEQIAEQLGERYREWLASQLPTGKPLLVAQSTEEAVSKFVEWADRYYEAKIVYDYSGDCIAAINLPSVEAAVRLYLLI